MPCILKQRTSQSPGIITFTQAEVLWGIAKNSKKVRDFISTETDAGRWIFGVHLQGDLSSLKEWPLEDWQRFIMWPETKIGVFRNVPEKRMFPMACAHFMPEIRPETGHKRWDVCIVSRASKIKRITETVLTMKEVLNLRPETKIIFVVPDERDIAKGPKTYELDSIDRNYFELPLKLFTAQEYNNISFLSASTRSFGLFPVASELVTHLISQSKFLALFSHKEGTPRVVPEAMMSGVPCIVSKNLRSGIRYALNERNTLFIDDDPKAAALAIVRALDYPESFHVSDHDADQWRSSVNLPALTKYLSDIIIARKSRVEGQWYLDDLHMRLAGHGKKFNFQFMQDADSFFHWLSQAETGDPYDEERSWRPEKIRFSIPGFFLKIWRRSTNRIKSVIKKIIRRDIYGPKSHEIK